MNKDWYYCPICKKKLVKIDYDKQIEGVFVQCPKCKREIEIKNETESRNQNTVAS